VERIEREVNKQPHNTLASLKAKISERGGFLNFLRIRRGVYTSSSPLSLPGGLKNPRIRPFMSGAYAGTIPAEILPLRPNEERMIVETMLTELNEKFCVSLDLSPSFDRSTPPSPTAHNTGRTVIIGGSNLGRIAKAAAENGHMIVDLTAKGWIPKSGKIGKLCETLKKLNQTGNDTLVIDSMSNTAFLGTDEDGLPIPAEKSRRMGGTTCMVIYSSPPPPSAFKSTMKLVETILTYTGEAKIVLTVPLPRYVLVACCTDTSHVSNHQDPEFLREFSGSEKSLSEAAAAGKRTAEARILNVLEFFGPLESPLQDLTTVDGASIWAGDGVHLTSNATRVSAMKMMASVIGGETAEPANKRARLESVIPARTTPTQAAKPVQPAPAPPPKPVPLPLWLSGQLPSNQRGNAHTGGQLRRG
jgi:hypothetical protein